MTENNKTSYLRENLGNLNNAIDSAISASDAMDRIIIASWSKDRDRCLREIAELTLEIERIRSSPDYSSTGGWGSGLIGKLGKLQTAKLYLKTCEEKLAEYQKK